MTHKQIELPENMQSTISRKFGKKHANSIYGTLENSESIESYR